jgi:hypothetical protein
VEIADLLAEAATCREKLALDEWADGSPAALELTDASERFAPAVDRLIRSADLWMLIATDHLVGISVIVRSGESMFSLFPLFRSVIEHSAYVVWVLDNQVDTRTRAARAALAALASQDALTGAATLIGGPGSPTRIAHRASGKQQRRNVEAEFDVTLGDPYRIDGEVLPRFTEIIEHFGQRWGDPRHWTGLYGYLCGTANHPSFNAYEYFDLTDPTASPPMLSIAALSRLLQPVMVSYLKALEAITSYMGLPEEPTNHFIDRVNNVLGPILT